MSHIINKIYLGDIDDAQNISFDVIVNMCNEPLTQDEVVNEKTIIFNINTYDEFDFDLYKYFDYTNSIIDISEYKRYRTLINCHAGISRSVTILMAYLLYKYKMSPQEAFEFILKKRDIINPNEGFRQQIKKYYKKLNQ